MRGGEERRERGWGVEGIDWEKRERQLEQSWETLMQRSKETALPEALFETHTQSYRLKVSKTLALHGP